MIPPARLSLVVAAACLSTAGCAGPHPAAGGAEPPSGAKVARRAGQFATDADGHELTLYSSSLPPTHSRPGNSAESGDAGDGTSKAPNTSPIDAGAVNPPADHTPADTGPDRPTSDVQPSPAEN